MERTRRQVLRALGATGAAALAGCADQLTRTPPARGTDTRADSDDDVASVAPDRTPTPVDVEGSAGTVTVEGTPVPEPFPPVYEAVAPSVVLVRRFGEENGQGSGFVLRADGETGPAVLVTNQHVVADADAVTVEFRDGSYRRVEVVGTDVYSDLAALRVGSRPATAAPLGLVETDPPIGTRVMALGAPFGFGESMSVGVVSGLDRSLEGVNRFQIADTVQTDAAVNPGNSGGPLVTADGRVVGVVTAGGGDNIGFAVSAAMVTRVIPALLADGEYDHPYMGVRIRDVTPPIASAMDLPEADGVLVVATPSGTPAAGVLEPSPREVSSFGQRVPVGGDVIVALDGTPIPTAAALGSYLATRKSPGDELAVTVIREGTRVTETFTLAERPPP
jgi:S1-C subfamily serine protease